MAALPRRLRTRGTFEPERWAVRDLGANGYVLICRMKAELAGASTLIDATSRRRVDVEIDVGELDTSLLLVTVPVS